MKIKANNQFYILGDKLIKYSPEKGIARVMNTIEAKEELPFDDIIKMGAVKIKRQKYSELMNQYFKDVKHRWVYQGEYFRKLDNFSKENGYYTKCPRHSAGLGGFISTIIVYHWGKVKMLLISGGYYPKGQIVDIATKELTGRWVDIKNVAPVFNETTKNII